MRTDESRLNPKCRLMCFAMLLSLALPFAVAAGPVKQTVPYTIYTGMTAGRSEKFRFTLYDVASGGTPIWLEVARYTVAADKTITHQLGSVIPFTSGLSGPLDFSRQMWLQVLVSGIGGTWKPVGQRGMLERIPYALWSAKSDVADFATSTTGLRVVPSAVSPNLIGGHPENTIAPDIEGAVIAGGGIASNPLDPDRPSFNEILGDFGAIVGGKRNKAGSYSFLGGGHNNQATGTFNALAGGEDNLATGNYSAILGGSGNEASGDNAAILGGSGNVASGPNSSVLAGSGSRATGDHSTVAGGCSNEAAGNKAFAAGEDASAPLNGMFVWSASDEPVGGILEEDGNFPSSTIGGSPNPYLAEMQFWAKAPGGVFFVNGQDVDGNPLGVMLPAGSQAWEPITPPVSDVNQKRDFAGVDGRVVLEKLAAIPVTTWSYRTDRVATRHIGPMAKDFSAAFGVGMDGRHIDPVDSGGVSLAAIQGLYAIVRELQERVSAQERELAVERAGSTALRARIDELALRYAELRLLIAGAPATNGSLASK